MKRPVDEHPESSPVADAALPGNVSASAVSTWRGWLCIPQNLHPLSVELRHSRRFVIAGMLSIHRCQRRWVAVPATASRRLHILTRA